MSAEIRTWIEEYLTRRSTKGLRTTDIPNDADLVELGILDSLGFIGLMDALREQFGVTLDLDTRPIEDFVRLGPLAELVAESVAGHGAQKPPLSR